MVLGHYFERAGAILWVAGDDNFFSLEIRRCMNCDLKAGIVKRLAKRCSNLICWSSLVFPLRLSSTNWRWSIRDCEQRRPKTVSGVIILGVQLLHNIFTPWAIQLRDLYNVGIAGQFYNLPASCTQAWHNLWVLRACKGVGQDAVSCSRRRVHWASNIDFIWRPTQISSKT